ncbi:MAG: outer membrane beta-barrel protein [Bacteroidota bacterium]
MSRSSSRCTIAFLLVLIASFSINEAYAQRPRYRPQVHELNLQLGSLHLSEDLNENEGGNSLLGTNIFNGLRYRYHIDIRQALRIGAFSRTQQFESAQGSTPYEANDRAYEVRIGYERKHHMRKWQVYGGIDLLLQQNQREETFSSDPNRDFSLLRGGGAFFLGARYFTSTNWSFVLESDLQVLGGLGEVPQNFSLNTPALATHLLTFSVAYHFKRMKKNCTCGKPGS